MIQNKRHKENVESRGYKYIGTYENNEIMLDNGNIKPKKEGYMRVKCLYCKKEYDTRVSGFNYGYNCKFCCNKYEKSFAHYIEVELGENLDKYWDWKKNDGKGINPYIISKASHKKIWIKCQDKEYHNSYEIVAYNFTKGCRCSYCSSNKIHPLDSFAQYHIDNTDKDFLEKYWDYEKNIINPYEIAPCSNKKIWIKCQEKSYHGSYSVRGSSFTYKNSRCPYCSHTSGKVHLYDSFGYNHFDKVCINWSSKNKLSPFKISCHNDKKFIFYCEECGKEFKKAITKIVDNESWCPNCKMSKGEKRIVYWLENNNIQYIYEKTFNKLLGVKNGLLSYDFYLPKYNLLIEYQGEQHESPFRYLNSETNFERQLEHDKRKREYAKDNKINLLEIWYWDFDNIEKILNNTLQVND